MPAKRRVTRQSKKFRGSPADLPTSDLPTYQDVARFIYKLKDTDYIKDKQDILKIASQELKKFWIKCNLRLILLNEKSIYVKLLRFYDNVIAWNSNKIKHLTRKLMTKNKNKLFDILACSCFWIVLTETLNVLDAQTCTFIAAVTSYLRLQIKFLYQILKNFGWNMTFHFYFSSLLQCPLSVLDLLFCK